MRDVILHIGYPKTATTSLQRFLANNAPALRAQGVLYPATGRLGDAHYGVNFSLGIADYDRPPEVPKSTTIAADLAAEAATAGCDRIVISSEYFATAKPADRTALKDLFADCRIRILCYLRRHDHALESAYTQAVRTVAAPPWRDSIESFVLHQLGAGTVSYDYLGVLRQWAGTFGTANIIVRPFEAAQNKPDIHGDFLAAIGVPDGPAFVRPPRENASLAPRTVAAIALVRRTALPDALKRRAVGQLVAADGRMPAHPHFLAPAIRRSVVQRNLPAYRAIAREFLGRAGALFNEALPADGEPWQDEAGFRTEELVETILAAIVPGAAPTTGSRPG